ncbi:MAG: GGDEF domain-containing protein [Candidatus Sedimenticola sp. 6PFRAG1]
MEIDHVINRLRDIFGYDVVVVIHKRYLNREKWEDGMHVLGRTADWDRFPSVVMSAEVPRDLPLILSERLERDEHGHRNEVIELEREGYSYWLLTMPIEDARGREVAQMTLLADVSFEMDVAERTAIVVGTTVFILGGILIVFFSRQANRVGRQIEQDEVILKELATRDSLTGLYTRRMFHEYLDAELARSIRFKHPLSLLRIDIDNFKQVNDTYGHPAGDAVLQKLSDRLLKESRGVDYVCRYGGEEIAIILPETDVQNAHQFSERIKQAVSALPFDIDSKQSVSVTISIGAASYPLHGETETFLIAAADHALYEAKEGGRNQIRVYSSEQ